MHTIMRSKRGLVFLSIGILAGTFTLQATALAQKAGDERVMNGPIQKSPGTQDGREGTWVEYTEYTYRYSTANDRELRDLLAWNSLSGTNVVRGDYNFKGKTLYRDAVDQVLNNPSWVGDHGNKKTWLQTYNTLTKQLEGVFTVTGRSGAPNTTSSLIEAGRLARIYQLLEAGALPPQSTFTGDFMAFYDERPYTIPLTKPAVLSKLQEVFNLGIDTYSPIVLDLNHDGKIGVTGKSSAAVRKAKNAFVSAGSVLFDLRAKGMAERYEWLNGDGDGFLVYDKGGAVTKAAKAAGRIDGSKLFGNVVGYDHGFQKLALLTGGISTAAIKLQGLPAAGKREKLVGSELKDLKVWVDGNRDAVVQAPELQSLSALGITELGLRPEFKENADGEALIVSYFVQRGARHMTEDVWFAAEPSKPARR